MDLEGGLGQTLGIEILELSKERARARMPVSPAHLQPLGYLHGGASIALAEHLASSPPTSTSPRATPPLGSR